MTRQIQTLKLYASGLQIKQVAHRMGVTIDTVNKHLAEARRRLNAKTTAEAIYKAAKIGMICWAGMIGGNYEELRRPPTVRAGLYRTIQQGPSKQQ